MKKKNVDGVCYHCGKKGHMSRDCKERKYNNKKKNEKTEKAVKGDADKFELCSLIMENKKRKSKKESLVCGEC